MSNRSNPRSKNAADLTRQNMRVARARWGHLGPTLKSTLRHYSAELCLSVERGDLLLIADKWYVTHSGLLSVARRNRCCGIQVLALPRLCDASASHWAFKATVYKSPRCKGFVGHGDADPTNVSPMVRGAEMRVAETRAVNRALRKAYGIGICSVEELGSSSAPSAAEQTGKAAVKPGPAAGNGHHPLRDRLRLIIRQHQLDPALVKAYAADYCEVSELREASREQVATFIKHLAEYAEGDREGLLCQLNSYAPKPPSPATAEQTSDQPGEKAAGAA